MGDAKPSGRPRPHPGRLRTSTTSRAGRSDEIRAMRAECQQAEVALSYLRRLIQGRLDIVHAYLEHAGTDSRPDLSTLVDRPARRS